jgi:hypothetical protein
MHLGRHFDVKEGVKVCVEIYVTPPLSFHGVMLKKYKFYLFFCFTPFYSKTFKM